MTTQKIISEAEKICKEYGLEPESIHFEHKVSCKDKKSSIEITVFYEDYKDYSNFHAVCYSFEQSFSIENLLNKLRETVINKTVNNNANKITFKNEN